MKITPSIPPSITPEKIKKIIVHSDGRTEYVLGEEKQPGALDFKKAAAFTVGSSTYFTTGYLKAAPTADIAKTLSERFWLVKPENGFDGLAGQLKGAAEQSHLRHIAVSASAGLVSWALLDAFTSLAPWKKTAIAAAIAAVVFALLQIYQPDSAAPRPGSATQAPAKQ